MNGDLTYYKLIEHEAVPCDMLEWAVWFGGADRVVKQECVNGRNVSTVFLGIDHSFGDGPPLLFETMVFDGEDWHSHQERCSTWTEAEAQHHRAVEWAKTTEEKE